jgi:hypothetical protein
LRDLRRHRQAVNFVACKCGLVQESEMVARNKKCLLCGAAMTPSWKDTLVAAAKEACEAKFSFSFLKVDIKENRMSNPAPHVFKAINDVKIKLATYGGIAKDRSSPDGGIRYKFRGIDDMYNALCGMTAEAGLVMVPSVVGEPRIEFQLNKNGNTQTHVFLQLDVLYASSVDGSTTTGRYFGEAIDSSDKASNKAMSAAFKYAHLMAFQIPTEGGEDDTEAHNTQVGQRMPAQQPTQHMPNMPPPQQAPQEAEAEAAKRTRRTKAEMEAARAAQGVQQQAAMQQGQNAQVPVQPQTVAAPLAPEPLPVGIPVPTESDWHVAYGQAVGKANSFKMILDLANDANAKPEPGRSEVFKAVKARTLGLIAVQANMDDLKEARALVQALGSGEDLKNAYNAKYMELRSAPQEGMMT